MAISFGLLSYHLSVMLILCFISVSADESSFQFLVYPDYNSSALLEVGYEYYWERWINVAHNPKGHKLVTRVGEAESSHRIPYVGFRADWWSFTLDLGGGKPPVSLLLWGTAT